MKAYVINLDRRPDRLAHMERCCSKHAFSFERIAAVDGALPEISERADKTKIGFTGKRIGPYELACFESHRTAWTEIKKGNDSFGLVLEDDLTFAPGFSNLLSRSWVPTDADIIRLETTGRYIHVERGSKEVGGRRLHRLLSTQLGAGAYVLSQKAASFLLEETLETVDPVDQTIFNQAGALFHRLRIYQMIPAPAVQASVQETGEEGSTEWGKSTLQEERVRIGSIRKRSKWSRLARTKLKVKGTAKSVIIGSKFLKVPYG